MTNDKLRNRARWRRLLSAGVEGVAESVAQEGFDRFEKRRIPWPCGLPDANETPDLMLGLAGIGYFYLRLAAPAKIPSVLLPQIKTALQ